MIGNYNKAAIGAFFAVLFLSQIGAFSPAFIFFWNELTPISLVLAIAWAVFYTLRYQVLTALLDKLRRKGVQHSKK